MGIEEVIDFYADSWIGGDLSGVRHLLAPDADLEWNLGPAIDEEELVQTLNRIAQFADGVTVIAKACNEQGAALVYDCTAPFGTARMAEFLTVAGGRITEVHQIYDTVAINRFFPGLTDD
jgi:ketosteroid isomerase-like protein